jgi:hypothetical protein
MRRDEPAILQDLDGAGAATNLDPLADILGNPNR